MTFDLNYKTKDWEKDVIQKLTSYSKKAPVLVSIETGMNEGLPGVFVTHVNSDTKYFFQWDYDVEPKEFVHQIKEVLFSKHYPRLVEVVYQKKDLSPRDVAIALEKGKDPKKLELRKIGTRMYVIDKVILWKNMVLLKLESSTLKSDEIGAVYRYRYSGSLVVYLRKYRMGKFKSLEEASKAFFNGSILIDRLGENGES
jgi:hypothetical protein